MTDEQLIEEVYKTNKIDVPDFHIPDDFGVSLGDKESWQQSTTKSVSSITDAEKEIKEFASAQNPVESTIDFIGENDFYYEFRLAYTRERETGNLISMRILVYKESAMFCTFNDQTGYYFEIRALDRDSVLHLLDLKAFFDIINWDSARIIRREFEETDNEYIYIYYRVSITGGDWGLNDQAVIEKIKYVVDKATGVITCYNENSVFKTVEIENTAKKFK